MKMLTLMNENGTVVLWENEIIEAIKSHAQRMKINNIHSVWKWEWAIMVRQIHWDLFSIVILNNVGIFFLAKD